MLDGMSASQFDELAAFYDLYNLGIDPEWRADDRYARTASLLIATGGMGGGKPPPLSELLPTFIRRRSEDELTDPVAIQEAQLAAMRDQFKIKPRSSPPPDDRPRD